MGFGAGLPYRCLGHRLGPAQNLSERWKAVSLGSEAHQSTGLCVGGGVGRTLATVGRCLPAVLAQGAHALVQQHPGGQLATRDPLRGRFVVFCSLRRGHHGRPSAVTVMHHIRTPRRTALSFRPFSRGVGQCWPARRSLQRCSKTRRALRRVPRDCLVGVGSWGQWHFGGFPLPGPRTEDEWAGWSLVGSGRSPLGAPRVCASDWKFAADSSAGAEVLPCSGLSRERGRRGRGRRGRGAEGAGKQRDLS